MRRFVPLLLLSGCGFLNPNIPDDLCGDGRIQGEGETCDDGGNLDDDGCSDDCRVEPGFLCTGEPSSCAIACGNNTIETELGETCDDGNTADGDHCDASCQIEACGDGVIDEANGEECDDGNLSQEDNCHNDCKLPSCGDGIIDPGQVCFDAAAPANLGEVLLNADFFGVPIPGTMRFADLNGDEQLDYIVSAPGSDQLVTGLNNGNALFQLAVASSIPDPLAISLADIDEDGAIDAVVSCTLGSVLAGNVSIMRGNGDGTFEGPDIFKTGNNPLAITVEDLDDDGILDIPVFLTTTNLFDGSDIFAIFSFESPEEPPVNKLSLPLNVNLDSTDLVVADLDQNGTKDLIAANSAQSSVGVLFQNIGGFSGPIFFDHDSGTFGVTVGDFNGDGLPDIVAANSNGGSLTIGLQEGNSFAEASTIISGFVGLQRVVSTDLDRDGNLDLIATVNSENTSFVKDVLILLGNGDGTFNTQLIDEEGALSAGAGSFDVFVGDLNGDSFPDLAVLNVFSNDISIILANP